MGSRRPETSARERLAPSVGASTLRCVSGLNRSGRAVSRPCWGAAMSLSGGSRPSRAISRVPCRSAFALRRLPVLPALLLSVASPLSEDQFSRDRRAGRGCERALDRLTPSRTSGPSRQFRLSPCDPLPRFRLAPGGDVKEPLGRGEYAASGIRCQAASASRNTARRVSCRPHAPDGRGPTHRPATGGQQAPVDGGRSLSTPRERAPPTGA